MATAKLTTILDARDRTSAKFRGVARNARRMDTGLRSLGAGLATYFSGRLLVGGFLNVTRASEAYRKELATVSTMLDTSTEQLLPSYRKEVARLAVAYGDSTTSLSSGLYNVLSASIPAAHALTFLRDSAKAAVGGITDTNTAVDGGTSLLNAYRWEASRSAEVFDLMFTTVKRGKLTFGELAGNIGKVAPVAKAANMSMGDTLALIATMTRQGYSVEQATTRIVALLKKFPDAGKDVLGLLKQFEGKDLSAIMQVVPETRAAQAIAALTADLRGLTADIDGMTRSAGAADEAYAKMANSRRFDRLGQAWITMKRNIGDMATESQGFGRVIDWLIAKLPNIPAQYDIIQDQIALSMLGAAEETKWAWIAMVESATWAWDVIKATSKVGATALGLGFVQLWQDASHFFTVQLPTAVTYFYDNWAKIASTFADQLTANWKVLMHNLAAAYEDAQRETAFKLAEWQIKLTYSGEEQEQHLASLRENRDQARAGAGGYQAFDFNMGDVFGDLKISERAKTEAETALEAQLKAANADLLATFGRLLEIPERELTEAERAIMDRIRAKKAALAGTDAAGAAGGKDAAGKKPADAAAAAARAAAATKGAELATYSARFLTRGQGLAEPAWVKAWNATTAKDQTRLRKEIKGLPDEIARAITQYLTANAVA